jgi:WXXGXW repeat (2 copies)
MHQLRNAVAALVIGACTPVAFAAPAFAQTCACAPEGGYVIQADEPPPPLPEYDQPPIPAPGYYWTPGYWAWNNYDYYWVPGVWVEPPQPGLLWTPGYWAFVGGVYAFRPGYWAPHVGFYGGINYGFGYAGSGYQGGRWDNGRFFYNTAVNNLGAARIANVYRQPIVANTTVNHASFNGGAGGVVAKPTNEELLAEKEPRVRATTLQTNQARAAGMRGDQFVSTNRGKPAIAATARPGEFKGKGAIPARAAGQAALVAPAAPAAPAPTGNAPPEIKEKPPIGAKPAQQGLTPNAAKVEEKPPAAKKLVKPEPTANPPKIEEKRPAERPARPEPTNSAQKAPDRPPAQAEHRPAQPERKPEAKECGRPGLPPCPR